MKYFLNEIFLKWNILVTNICLPHLPSSSPGVRPKPLILFPPMKKPPPRPARAFILRSLLLLFWNQTWGEAGVSCLSSLSHNNNITCITLIGSPVSLASCSLMCRVGFGVWLKAVLRTSNCFALIVVLGPLLLPPVTQPWLEEKSVS